MGNKVKYNLKNVHAAKLTRGEDGSFTYAKPKAIPGAVSISLDAEGDSSPFYADGIVYFRSTANNGYSGDLEIALIPEWFRTEILKEELDNNGVLIENATITELEKFALLRCIEIGISIRDLDLLTIGMVMDIWTEKANDDVKYQQIATQEDFDKF